VRVAPAQARLAVVQFPGTNCERETVRALRDTTHCPVDLVWHADHLDPDAYAGVVLPGGFAHGDHLRAGAIARFSSAMRGVQAMADAGKPVLGICNGFQVLLEAGLLPGAMLRNASLRFVSEWVWCRVERTDTPFTSACQPGQMLHLPIAHGEGNYTAESPEALERLEASQAVVLRYVSDNPNGSLNAIAGVINGSVFGLMPHPERASDDLLGSTDGRLIFESMHQALAAPQEATLAA
jgi:phosphoribosylformylglycinamidine synthase subunit PurQ / glutaminase